MSSHEVFLAAGVLLDKPDYGVSIREVCHRAYRRKKRRQKGRKEERREAGREEGREERDGVRVGGRHRKRIRRLAALER